MTASEWGDPGRYYAGSPEAMADTPLSKRMTANWRRVLADYSPDLENRVQVAVKDWGPSIREQLRIETALRLSAQDQHVGVPVRVASGVPPPLWQLADVPEAQLRLLLRRGRIAEAASGARFVQQNFLDVATFLGTRPTPQQPGADADDLQRVEALLERLSAALAEVNPLEGLWREPVDWLGAYFFHKPVVEIYWIPIGVTAALCQVDVEALTYVVLAHELAHAYTHLGRDIDGQTWSTPEFAKTSDYVVEGLAQHYTRVLCRKAEPRYPAALKAFEALLEKQTPGPYADFVKWTEKVRDPGEHMRRTMLKVRRQGIREYREFQAVLWEQPR